MRCRCKAELTEIAHSEIRNVLKTVFFNCLPVIHVIIFLLCLMVIGRILDESLQCYNFFVNLRSV